MKWKIDYLFQKSKNVNWKCYLDLKVYIFTANFVTNVHTHINILNSRGYETINQTF